MPAEPATRSAVEWSALVLPKDIDNGGDHFFALFFSNSYEGFTTDVNIGIIPDTLRTQIVGFIL